MRCRDVKRRLNRAVTFEADLLEHIRACPSCAREVEAARLLELSLKSDKDSADLDTTIFNDMKTRLEALASQENRKERSIMTRIKNQFSSHPGFSFGIIAAICLFAVIVLVPISYDKTVGYNLVMSDINTEDGVDLVTVDNVVDAIGYTDVQISSSIDDKKLKIIFENLPSKKAVREITSAVASLAATGVMTEVSPIIVKDMGSIYAQVRDKLSELKIDAKGKSDKEIQEAIETELRKRGHPNPEVVVVTKPDGQREIRINSKFDEKNKSGDIEHREQQMVIMSEGDTLVMEPGNLDRLEIDGKGKTDAQIEQEIRDKLKAQGIENPDITIKTQPDGKREIKIEAEKKDNR